MFLGIKASRLFRRLSELGFKHPQARRDKEKKHHREG
jgi:hypothetical protein